VQPGYFKTAWLRAELNRQNGRLAEAIDDYRAVLSTVIPERKFDFGKDREIRRQLADTIFRKAQLEEDGSPEQQVLVREAITEMQEVLKIDPEDRQAHYLLDKFYRQLGDTAQADRHLAAYEIYQIDNNARDYTVQKFRLKHPWFDHTSQAVVIYDLRPVTSK
jgi:tetratricopeptide (TPR) repeat protein